MTGIGVSLVELVDFLLAASLVYLLILWLKDARARLALVGVSILGIGYLVAVEADLSLTAHLLQAALLVSTIMLVLVFQEDLRRSFERLALLVLRRERRAPPSDLADTLARSAFDLAAVQRGALIVLPGHEPVERHVSGGVPLDGTVSEPLLLSLFDPNSPGHDGAVVLAGDQVRLFAAHLPLSSNFRELGLRGTRHAAALGLSERCDALAVVVSEEHGTISVARHGRLHAVESRAHLAALLRGPAVSETHSTRRRRRLVPLVRAHAGQILAALAVSLVLWLALVPGARVSTQTFMVPVEVTNLPAGYELQSVTPPTVRVEVAGVRRALFLLKPGDLRVGVDAFLVQLGRRSFDLPLQSVRHPPGVSVTAVEPDHVDLAVRAGAGAPSAAGTRPS